MRLYACGGDGTLTETATGAAGCPRAQIAAVPCGSANDYVRSYGGTAAFLDIPAQVHGRAVPVDAVDCGDRVSMNSASMGMDAAVAQKMVRYKNLPLVSGPMSYNLAIADVFCHRIGVDLHVVMDTPDGRWNAAAAISSPWPPAPGFTAAVTAALPARWWTTACWTLCW